MKRTFILIFSFFLFIGSGPGERYTFKHEGDGVKVYYRWKKSFLFFFSQRKTLDLYLANENDYRVLVSFDIDVYKNAVLYASSDSLTYCIPPNYEITGRFRKLMFDASMLPDEESSDTMRTGSEKEEKEDLINWEINDFNVERSEDCETEANWRE